MTMQNNITNKSYVQGIDNLFQTISDTERKGAKFIGNIMGGFVPNVFNQSMNMEDERMLLETRNYLDYLRKRTPEWAPSTYGNRTDLPPKRDPLGDALTMKPKGFFGESGGIGAIFNPIYSREESTNLVDNELAALGGFSNPTYMMGERNIDLRDEYNENGIQAYDRFQELQGSTLLNGKTLRQSMDELIRKPSYQKLSAEVSDEDASLDVESPRKRELRKLLSAYRTRAKLRMLEEFPEVRKKLKEVQNLRRTGGK